MSLREYRNRKKTKPAATLIHGASTINEGLAAKTLSQSILFTDTDSLLTPRTLSLSTGFTPLSCKDVTLTTSSSDSVSMTTLMSSQIPIETPSTEPLFEPVSPGDDFVAETMPNDEGTLCVIHLILSYFLIRNAIGNIILTSLHYLSWEPQIF